MTLFKPCIDLHQGKVKQIIGETLSLDDNSASVNFESDKPSAWYADLFKKDGLTGGHIIQLGSGNKEAAYSALENFPGGMQVGGGVNSENAEAYLNAGASHVIITSWVFPDLQLDLQRLKSISQLTGKENLVLDLSCRRTNQGWMIAKNKWQTITNEPITPEFLSMTSEYCSEFLIHAADVEGKCEGIDEELVTYLGKHVTIPTTYAGGAKNIQDLELVKKLSAGKVDLTIGSALDIFGGKGAKYRDCVAFNKDQAPKTKE